MRAEWMSARGLLAAARSCGAAVSGVRRGWLAAWAAAMALLGWALMTIGAFVRASESGLGCPDWPACHGALVAGGHHAVIEEFHRWVAAVLIVLAFGLALTVFRAYRHERRVTRPMVWVLAPTVVHVALARLAALLR